MATLGIFAVHASDELAVFTLGLAILVGVECLIYNKVYQLQFFLAVGYFSQRILALDMVQGVEHLLG